MMKKPKNITNRLAPWITIALILGIWGFLSFSEAVPRYMLPSPMDVVRAFIGDFNLLMQNMVYTLSEAFIGLGAGIAIGFLVAIAMDQIPFLNRALYPILVVSQTIPTVAIAPLLVLWMGYEMLPKVVLIILTTFFPIAIGVLEGFRSVDRDAMNLIRAMGGNRWQQFVHIKFPSALPAFFSGLKISVTYSVVGAVVAEWLGGFMGLGVYMTRVRKAYAYDKMFAVIFFISFISLLLMALVSFLQKRALPWKYKNTADHHKEE